MEKSALCHQTLNPGKDKLAPHPYGPPSVYQPLWTFSSLAAWDLFAFQWHIILLWNRDYEHLEKRLVKPRGMPDSCPFTAYTYPFSSEEAKEKATQPYGPFLPMLNHFGYQLFAIEPPRWDPLEYLENRQVEKREKKRKRK
ncbi:unnamed protein product [Fusarium venenatum]|uniref:Uncharacterized protein n=1 Tax=Fusarium venenatum TaxID=56646 RepID=A0A2L2TKF7_9HYPO|nr:LOW QUALITY PROTEIN: uncharacterized protein FVRRES_13578 [Fusarium venenatum]CEI41437.1 unnamed protein product [Fusarium venenatum]